MKRIALATSAKLPTLNEDDRLLIPALAERGLAAVPAVWDAPDVCWEEFQGVVVRSCWDYHHRLEEFLTWVARLERAGIPVWNPPAVLRWNSHKGYLRDLAARGVPIVPTRWLARGRRVGLARLLRHERWSDAVVKRPAAADYRVQWEFGGTAAPMAPPPRLVADAAAVMAAVPGHPLYARVDGVERDDRLMLMELELIEPHLFLGWDADATGRLARVLAAFVTRP